MTQTGRGAKPSYAFVVKQSQTCGRIIRLLLKKPRLPLSPGYFFNVLNVAGDDLVWCLRFMEEYGFVDINWYSVHVATIQKSRLPVGNAIGIRIMRLLNERSPRGHVSMSYALKVPTMVVVEKLNELESLGLVSVKSKPVEFVSLTGGRPHLLLQSLKMVVTRRKKI